MNSTTLLIIASIVLWGVWGFLGKLAVMRINIQAAFWSALAFTIVIILYLAFTKQLIPLKLNHQGIFIAILAGIVSGLATVFFYIVLGKKPAGFLVTITALYPAVTIILSMIFLKEGVTPIKALGFLFALIALVLLNI